MSSAISLTATVLGSLPLSTDGMLDDGEGLVLLSIDEGTVGDEGGHLVTATGTFPPGEPILFRIQDAATGLDALCFSGVVGQGEFSQSEDGATIGFVVPPLPVGGPYDVFAENEDATLSSTIDDALTVVFRTAETTLYGLRSGHPPPRDAGPYDISEEPGE